jgi:5,10-methenyltetrahydrofolate synthetase
MVATKQRVSLAAQKAELRKALRHRRSVIPYDLRSTTQWKVINHLRTLIGELAPTVVALYAAQDGEINLEPLAQELWRDGQTVALPRVVARGLPLVFNVWPPHGKLEADSLGIAAATGPEILPALVVTPMLGYSREGYRLGYGGGYYDKTFSNFNHPCRKVGVCYTELELPATFKPEPHDVRLDFIVTGKGVIASVAAPPPLKPKTPTTHPPRVAKPKKAG